MPAQLSLAAYRNAPAAFVRDILGDTGHPHPKQAEFLRLAVNNRRVSVVGCNGSGKDWAAARLVLWWIETRPHAKAVVTDSGGITEETTVMGVPCITLRNSTERPETVTIGTNELIGTDPARLAPTLDRLFAGEWKRGGIPPLWDGRAGERIVAHLARLLEPRAAA